ncbi:DMT family transporter [bacterium]|nr:DMT family transporter [bacterium]
MTFLFLTIICSSAIGLSFKYSEKNYMHRYTITTANYVTASAIGLILVIKNGLIIPEGSLSAEQFFEEFSRVVSLNSGVLSVTGSWIWSLLVGILNGVFFLFALIVFQKSIGENGIALSAMSSRLGVLIPMSISIILWNELPNRFQVFGIILAICSIVLVNLNFNQGRSGNVKPSLIMLFIFAGGGIFCNKLFQKYALLQYKNLFLFFVFTTALLISLYFLRTKHEQANRNDILVGIVVGVFNLLSNYFMILALNELKASVVFPITSAGAIIMMTLGGWLFFKEHLRPKDLVAVIMTLFALVLINI